MSNLGWRSIVLRAALGFLALAGCSSESLKSGDGGLDHAAGGDPAACGCQLAADALTISWACYCQQYDCANQPERSCGSSGYGQWTRGCGLDEYSFMTVGGPERHVYDQSGQLVGAQTSSDTTPFSCPTDSNLVSSSLRAGQFADTCDGAVTCVCDGDAGSCGTPEAGVINPL